MVADRGPGALLVGAPGGIVAVLVLLAGTLRVDVVAEGEDGSRYFAHKPCRFAVGLEVASGDVSRAEQRHRLGLADARRSRQQGRHGCHKHRGGHRTDNKNGLAHPLHPPLCAGWRRTNASRKLDISAPHPSSGHAHSSCPQTEAYSTATWGGGMSVAAQLIEGGRDFRSNTAWMCFTMRLRLGRSNRGDGVDGLSA
jgi:hypothetical protein